MTDINCLDSAIREFERQYYNLKDDTARDLALRIKYGLERIKAFCLEKGYKERTER